MIPGVMLDPILPPLQLAVVEVQCERYLRIILHSRPWVLRRPDGPEP